MTDADFTPTGFEHVGGTPPSIDDIRGVVGRRQNRRRGAGAIAAVAVILGGLGATLANGGDNANVPEFADTTLDSRPAPVTAPPSSIAPPFTSTTTPTTTSNTSEVVDRTGIIVAFDASTGVVYGSTPAAPADGPCASTLFAMSVEAGQDRGTLVSDRLHPVVVSLSPYDDRLLLYGVCPGIPGEGDGSALAGDLQVAERRADGSFGSFTPVDGGGLLTAQIKDPVWVADDTVLAVLNDGSQRVLLIDLTTNIVRVEPTIQADSLATNGRGVVASVRDGQYAFDGETDGIDRGYAEIRMNTDGAVVLWGSAGAELLPADGSPSVFFDGPVDNAWVLEGTGEALLVSAGSVWRLAPGAESAELANDLLGALDAEGTAVSLVVAGDQVAINVITAVGDERWIVSSTS